MVTATDTEKATIAKTATKTVEKAVAKTVTIMGMITDTKMNV